MAELASAGDAEAVIALWRACGLTRPWNDPAGDFQRAVSGPASEVLILRDGGEVVGSVMVGHDGHRGWVYYLAVVPERQGCGFGRALMRAAETWLRDRGIPKIQLMVRTGNGSAERFYRSLGYAAQEVTVFGKFFPEEAP